MHTLDGFSFSTIPRPTLQSNYCHLRLLVSEVKVSRATRKRKWAISDYAILLSIGNIHKLVAEIIALNIL